MLIFSENWLAAYISAINSNAAYRDSSKGWENGSIAYAITDDGRAALLDLLHGECLGARALTADEALESAAFVIEGDITAWQEVLAGKIAPLMALMRGKLKLKKGSMMKIMPYAKAAEELVRSAQYVPTEF